VWRGVIVVSKDSKLSHIEPFGGVVDVPKESITQTSDSSVVFDTHTSGDFDSVNLSFAEGSSTPQRISISEH
jgi:hypothetical protein